MSRAAILQTQLDHVDARIAELLAQPKPTYEVQGQRVEWASYLDTLRRTRDELLQQRRAMNGYSSTPQEIL